MDLGILAAVLSVIIAIIAIYIQYFAGGNLRVTKPRNCMIGPLKDHGIGITVPLSIYNGSSRPFSFERFSFALATGEHKKLPEDYQSAMIWLICNKLDADTDVQLGTPLTILGRTNREILLGFCNATEWHFTEGGSEIFIYYHPPKKEKRVLLTHFAIHLMEIDIRRIKRGEYIRMYQHFYPDGLLIPEQRFKDTETADHEALNILSQ